MFSRWKKSIELVHAPFTQTVNPYDIDPTQQVLTAIIRGAWHPKMADYLIKKDVRAVYLNSGFKFTCTDYSFLKDLNQLELLSLNRASNYDKSALVPIENLSRLRNLSGTLERVPSVDFTCFPELQSISTQWVKSLNAMFECPKLKRLQLTGLSWKHTQHLAQLKTLENLELSHSGIKSFAPITELRNLTRLSLSVCRSLENLDGVEALSNLKLLNLTEVHKVSSLDCLAPLKNLEVLTIRDCGDLTSLAPLENLKNLKAVAITGARTTVIDGDLTPLTKLPNLSMLMFGARKHYSHKLIKKWNWDNLMQPDTLLETQ